jgi:hypothetical protein
MSVDGTWNLTINTPIGRQHAILELSTSDGVLSGVARDPAQAEAITLVDLTLAGDRLTWAQSITRPMRLNLNFDVTVDRDELAGTARAGRLPSSRVSGHRVPG